MSFSFALKSCHIQISRDSIAGISRLVADPKIRAEVLAFMYVTAVRFSFVLD